MHPLICMDTLIMSSNLRHEQTFSSGALVKGEGRGLGPLSFAESGFL